MKRLIFLYLFFATWTASAEIIRPAEWALALAEDDTLLTLTAEVTLAPEWHLYDVTLPTEGPTPTTLVIDTCAGLNPVGDFRVTAGTAQHSYDDNFGCDLSYYASAATFCQTFAPAGGHYLLTGYVSYMCCRTDQCTPPAKQRFRFEGEVAHAATVSIAPAAPEAILTATAAGDEGVTPWWQIFLAGFAGGLVALVTPCVWPMIPMTVSFFLKRTKVRRKSIRDACLYGLAIILIYLTLGLVISLLFGASALNAFSTSAVANLFFFALLVLFGVSFLGAFELTLPAKWTTRLDAHADATTGFVSLFFMAFTLCLVSFSCTGPIIGTLLVETATTGSLFHPALGMLGFALALALPFSLFACFPSALHAMPSSGQWLGTVKSVLGFIELALSLKFLSQADLAYGWHILDREVFLAVWITLFTLLGCYLMGWFHLPHDEVEPAPVSLSRLLLAVVTFSFSLYMLPGLWGAPCKAIAAFAPPLSTQDFNLYADDVKPQYHTLDEALQAAERTGKPILLDFSGYGCVNCRKMEAAVWTHPAVREALQRYIVVSLMVDDKTPLPAAERHATEHGHDLILDTYGDKWSLLQRERFNTNAQPYHVILSPTGQPLGAPQTFTDEADTYLRFLQQGLPF